MEEFEALRAQLLSEPLDYFRMLKRRQRGQGRVVNDVEVISPDALVALTDDQESTFSSPRLHAFYQGQIESGWWDDRPQGAEIIGLKNGHIHQDKGQDVRLSVAFITPRHYANHRHFFTFSLPEKPHGFLPAAEEERERLREQIEPVRKRFKDVMMNTWLNRPAMPSKKEAILTDPESPRPYHPYIQPRVSEAFVSLTGVAFFMTTEQVSHMGSNPIMRYQLVVTTLAGIKRGLEDVFDVRGELGYQFLIPIFINPDRVVVETIDGRREFPISVFNK